MATSFITVIASEAKQSPAINLAQGRWLEIASLCSQ
jgi:hypothetical protein